MAEFLHLSLADRIDLLIRDAAVTWQAAFSPALVFQLPYLAGDEPFGPDWQSLEPQQAERLLRDSGGSDPGACAQALGIEDVPVSCPDLAPTSKLVVAGGSAILAVARRFQDRSDLSWSDQVLVVAEQPVNRHLAGLVAPVIGAQASTRLIAPAEDVVATLRAVSFSAPGEMVVSADAPISVQEFAARAASGA